MWTGAGYGAGRLLLSPGAGTPVETGLSIVMAASGGRGQIFHLQEQSGGNDQRVLGHATVQW